MTAPLDDLRRLIADLPGQDEAAAEACAARAGLGGRLLDLAVWVAAWQGRADPQVARPIAALYVSAHSGVSTATDPKEILRRLAEGGGAIGAVAKAQGAGVEVFDLAVDRPVPDAAAAPPMSERECAATAAFGMEAMAKSPDLLVLSEAAAGAERAAGALAHALFGGAPGDWAAPGEEGWTAAAVARARGAAGEDPLQLLRQLGGRESAAIAGALLAARSQKTPVLLDGYAALAAAAALQAIRPDVLGHCRLAQLPPGRGPARLADALGKTPLLDLGLGESQGVGGLVAANLVKLACAAAADGEAPGDL